MNLSRKITLNPAAMLAAASLAIAGVPATAATPQDIITARQVGFKKMGAAMKALNEQLKGDAPAKPVMIASAQTIATTAREQPKLFPAGSGPAAGVKTDALPGIWTDRATFDAQMGKLIAESGKLAAVANGGDVAAIRAQAKATGAACAACHRQFRADS